MLFRSTTMVGTEGSDIVRWRQSHKAGPSSDRGLQFVHVKEESLVIADQQAAVNTFPGLVHTARHTTKVSLNRSCCANRKEAGI